MMRQGRFQSKPAESLQRFSESISFDWRLYRHDIAGSVAHAAALEAAGILTADEKRQIESALREIEREIAEGKFQFKTELEDIHMNIESALAERIGAAGEKLHTARSRNDQIALDLRLYLREETVLIQQAIRELQGQLVTLASSNADAVMPGYTHLQRAQPVFFAHHLLAYVEMLDRDHARLENSLSRTNTLPLGSGALAGSIIALDRNLVAELLGFALVSWNSMDAVSDRDFAAEFLAAVAILGMHLSRFSEDLVLWSTSEFGFLEISDAFSTGSSLMPQKKNPDAAELCRGKTGRLYGNLMALLTTLKGLPLTYNRDLQEDKEPVFDSVDTIRNSLTVLSGMMSEARLNAEPARAAASDPALYATDVADYLVKKGVPFRQAHHIVGVLVAQSLEKNVSLSDLPVEDYREACPEFGEDVFDLFDPEKSLRARKAQGSPSPENVAAELKKWRMRLSKEAS